MLNRHINEVFPSVLSYMLVDLRVLNSCDTFKWQLTLYCMMSTVIIANAE